MRPGSKAWTKEERDAFLGDWMLAGSRVSDLSIQYGRSPKALQLQAKLMGLPNKLRDVRREPKAILSVRTDIALECHDLYVVQGKSLTETAALLSHTHGIQISRGMIGTFAARQGWKKTEGHASAPGAVKAPKPAPRPRSENALASNIIRKFENASSAPPKEPMREPDAVKQGAVGILELSGSTCRWPVGLAGGFEQMFCGRRPWAEGKPYCDAHRVRAGGLPVSAKELTRSLRRII